MLLGTAEISWILAMIFPPLACFRAFPGQPSSLFHGSLAQASVASVRDREGYCSWSDSSSSRRISRRDVQSDVRGREASAWRRVGSAQVIDCFPGRPLSWSPHNQAPRPADSSSQTSLRAVSSLPPLARWPGADASLHPPCPGQWLKTRKPSPSLTSLPSTPLLGRLC